MCLLALKHLVSLQAHTRPSFQTELDLRTAADELIEMEKKKKEMLYLYVLPTKPGVCEAFSSLSFSVLVYHHTDTHLYVF